jgi:hypothetical protein
VDAMLNSMKDHYADCQEAGIQPVYWLSFNFISNACVTRIAIKSGQTHGKMRLSSPQRILRSGWVFQATPGGEETGHCDVWHEPATLPPSETELATLAAAFDEPVNNPARKDRRRRG